MSSVLFLQGPHGPFFAKLAKRLSQLGISTHKINFNGGDRHYGWADHQVDFTGRDSHWPDFFRAYLREHAIDLVLVYGDCRLYHRLARQVCDELGVLFGVFEEGYLRPDYVTLEWGGVNAYSGTDWSRRAIESYKPSGRVASTCKVGQTFAQRAWFAIIYYLCARLNRSSFPHYHHHRNRDWKGEACGWLCSFWRKGLYKFTQRGILSRLTGELSDRYFLFPLQTCDDFQLRTHSDLLSIEHSIDMVIKSFAANAPADEFLVIKHHPMDRGFRHYGKLIDSLAGHRGVRDRVIYCHDLHLPTLLHHTRGVVTINSTVGISALLHGVPTKVLGRALYDIPGLTHQGDLHGFWQHPEAVDRDLFRRFRTYLYERTQLDGSFFKYIDSTVEAVCLRLMPVIAGNRLPTSREDSTEALAPGAASL